MPTESVTHGTAEIESGQSSADASTIEATVTTATRTIPAVCDDQVNAAMTSTSSQVQAATSPTGTKRTHDSRSIPTVTPIRTASRSGQTSGGTTR